MQQSPEKKIGLVLEGGGAKGSYQFGVLKVFAEHGMAFDCIAGTSVGGLNATLWGAGKLSAGDDLWFHLDQDKIYPWRRPRWLARLFAILLVPLSIAVNYIRGGLSLPPTRKGKIIVGFAVGLLTIFALLGAVLVQGAFSLFFLMSATVLASILIFYNSQGYVKQIIGAYISIPIYLMLLILLFEIQDESTTTACAVWSF